MAYFPDKSSFAERTQGNLRFFLPPSKQKKLTFPRSFAQCHRHPKITGVQHLKPRGRRRDGSCLLGLCKLAACSAPTEQGNGLGWSITPKQPQLCPLLMPAPSTLPVASHTFLTTRKGKWARCSSQHPAQPRPEQT